MPVSFRIRTRLDGALKTVTTKNTKDVSKLIRKHLNDEVVKVAAPAIALTAREVTERNLYAAAVFFQRVVSRTPLDEDYVYKGKVHKADNDVVRDCWTASYGQRKITAKELRESYGVEFMKFNDTADIDTIYMVFRSIFTRKFGAVRQIFIENNHNRFVELEYGGYKTYSTVPKEGPNYEHGILNKHSVQAPYGMLRITQAEFKEIVLNAKSSSLVRGYAQKSQRLAKVPSAAKMKRLTELILNRNHLSNDEIDEVESILRG